MFWINCHKPWHRFSCKRKINKGILKLQKKKIVKKWPTWKTNIEKNGDCSYIRCPVWLKLFEWETKEEKQLNSSLTGWHPEVTWEKYTPQILIVLYCLCFWLVILFNKENDGLKFNWGYYNMTAWKFTAIVMIFFPITFPLFFIFWFVQLWICPCMVDRS